MSLLLTELNGRHLKKCSFYFEDLFIFETATNKVLRIAVFRYFEF